MPANQEMLKKVLELNPYLRGCCLSEGVVEEGEEQFVFYCVKALEILWLIQLNQQTPVLKLETWQEVAIWARAEDLYDYLRDAEARGLAPQELFFNKSWDAPDLEELLNAE